MRHQYVQFKQDLKGFDKKYNNIVDYIIDITYEIWERRKIWDIYDTYSDNVKMHMAGNMKHGVDAVVVDTAKVLHAFPDRRPVAEAVVWSDEGSGSFLSSHRVGSFSHHTGDSEYYGKATGKAVFRRGMANCMCKENKIYEEWLVIDNLYIIEQLGLDVVAFAKKDGRYNKGVFALQNPPTNVNLKYQSADANLVNELFQEVWKKQDVSKLSEYYHSASIIHWVCGQDLLLNNAGKKLIELFSSFDTPDVRIQKINYNTYENETEIACRWSISGKHTKKGLFSTQESGREIFCAGTSHFLVRQGKIAEEWVVFDGLDVFCQIYANIK